MTQSADNIPGKHPSGDSPASLSLTPEQLCGRDESALVGSPWGTGLIHRDLYQPLNVLVEAADRAGFRVRLASGYRGFDRQRRIWDAKASGARPVLDERGEPLNIGALDELALVHAIMRWSALPGSSRHHWGTDVDVYDAAGLAEGEALQLTRRETEPGGPFAAFHAWLDRYLASAENPGFYRPYDRDRGGVAPEPWHLSYAPLANRFARAMTPERLADYLQTESFALKETVMDRLPELFHRYVTVPEGPESAL
ncbi:M15 family metallopeptidase [Marinimicrobium sp. C6131]|uniref:M15 family metallopeptidase n=1 Tax=Marinimicrobium sp. C6131 TaxID=3022676 RepID=UPI00223E68C0|nr:M15 family metallopeptidase [Marinimicrobium sp. C6131]UZJ46158.1 M15 family metallopeptidase [Marinimicrobium sp. C6131]